MLQMLQVEGLGWNEFAPFAGRSQTAPGAGEASQAALAQDPQFILKTDDHGGEGADFRASRSAQRLEAEPGRIFRVAFNQAVRQQAQDYIESDWTQRDLVCRRGCRQIWQG